VMHSRLNIREIGVPDKASTCAIIVTHHPDPEFQQGFAKIVDQVACVVIVDNASNSREKNILRSLARGNKAVLIENPRNLGSARALNQGMNQAIEQGYSWALTLDQDSQPESDLILHLAEIYLSHPRREEIGVIGAIGSRPKYRRTTSRYSDEPFLYREVEVVITSGSLLIVPVFRHVGPFRDDFFIDQVDHEYCLRLRAQGYRVLRSSKPLMRHAVGVPTRHCFLGIRLTCSNHSPIRRYYITRNRLALYREYMCKDTYWIMRDLGHNWRECMKILLFEDRKCQKLLSTLLGCCHAIIGRMGKLQHPSWE